MLVFSRYEGQAIRIGDDIVITLVRSNDGKARVGITAPSNVKILRGELYPQDRPQEIESRCERHFSKLSPYDDCVTG